MILPNVRPASFVLAAVFAAVFNGSCQSKPPAETDRNIPPARKSSPQEKASRLTYKLESLKPAPPKQKGIALGLYSEDRGWSYEPLLSEIARTGASHVSLVAAYYLNDIYASKISIHPRYSPSDEVLRRTIRQARKLGLKVLLFPILRVLRKPAPDHWRGNLKPKDKAALRKAYTGMMVRLARLSAEESVDLLSVGSELSTLDTDVEFFKPVVVAIRAVYKGKLLYSGNWDHFRKVKIWPLTDFAGLCGYFGIALKPVGASVAEMVEGWRDLMVELVRWSRLIKKPLVFTEVGYMSQHGAARSPWDEGARKPVDLEEQRRAYEAFVRVWNGRSDLAGAYFWNWYGWGGRRDHHYTPRNKPAARIISFWYGGQWPIKWWKPE